MRDENVVFAEWKDSSGDRRRVLEEELIKCLQAHAHAVCVLTLHGHHPDIVSNSVWRALRHADRFRGESKFSTWFHIIVLRQCANYLEEKTRRNETGIDDLSYEETAELSTQVEIEPQIHLAELVAHLDEEDKQFVAEKMEGKTDSELAEIFGLTPGGARKRWFTIRKLLLAQSANSSPSPLNASSR